MKHYILWGMPASLYTAKARSYLIKRGVPFVEYGVNHPEFSERVAPAVGRFILPVVECPDGRLIQDGANIIDELDVICTDVKEGDVLVAHGPPSVLSGRDTEEGGPTLAGTKARRVFFYCKD